MDTKVLLNNPEILCCSSFLTPLGYVYIAKSTHGVCQISFPYSTENDIVRLIQNNNLPRSIHGNTRINIQRNDSLLKHEIDLLQAYFQGKQVDFDFPLDLSSSTTFQKRYGKNCGKFRMENAVPMRGLPNRLEILALPGRLVWQIIRTLCRQSSPAIGSLVPMEHSRATPPGFISKSCCSKWNTIPHPEW